MKQMYCKLAVLMAERDPSLSQRKVAEDTKLSTATVNKLYLNRFDRVDRHTVEVLCEYFGCEVGDLLVLKGEG
ncbi:MAG: helix-turn-helix transcriptional regulator [Synechococcaceae cyanobacterium SM2_3_2]|nr:helix-turn-helix transcriptional regulator [Synechococcaceae cyanobacterium SM2_3_2]